MDQKRLMLAIALSLGILLVFQFAVERFLPHPPPSPTQTVQQAQQRRHAAGGGGRRARRRAAPAGAPSGPRLAINAPKISGSIGLTGAVFDDVVLKDYHETIAKDSPLVQLLGRRGSAKPSYAQFGWTPVGNIKVPTDATVWTPSGHELTPQSPVTLSWDNGAGLTFQLLVSVDDNYMFTVRQQVINHTGAPVQLFPWSRVVRDYKPVEQSSYILYDGPLGVFNDTLHQQSYNSIKSDGPAQPRRPGLLRDQPRRLDRHHRQILADRAGPGAKREADRLDELRHRHGRRRQCLSDLVHHRRPAHHRPRCHRQPADASVHRRQSGAAAGRVWARIRHPEFRQVGGFRLPVLHHQADLLLPRLAEFAAPAISAWRSSSSPSA